MTFIVYMYACIYGVSKLWECSTVALEILYVYANTEITVFNRFNCPFSIMSRALKLFWNCVQAMHQWAHLTFEELIHQVTSNVFKTTLSMS